MSRSTSTHAAHRLGLLGRHVSTALPTPAAAAAPSAVTVLSDITVSQTPGRQCAYPRAVVLADGTVIVAYVCAYPDKHSYDTYILTQRSGDGGATFEPPTVLFDGREENLAGDQAGLAQCSDGSVVAFVSFHKVTDDANGYKFSDEGFEQEHDLVAIRSRAPTPPHLVPAPPPDPASLLLSRERGGRRLRPQLGRAGAGG